MSYRKEKELAIKQLVKKGMRKVSSSADKLEVKGAELLERWQEKSSEMVDDFGRFFDKIGSAVTKVLGPQSPFDSGDEQQGDNGADGLTEEAEKEEEGEGNIEEGGGNSNGEAGAAAAVTAEES